MLAKMVSRIFLLVVLHGFYLWCLGNGQACNSFGFICSTCTSLQFCTGGVPASIVLTCPANTFCDSSSPSYCSSTPCTTEPPAFYNCTSAGRFAVSNNCTRYIFCSNSTTSGVLVPSLLECPGGTVFNPNTALCVLPTDAAFACTDGSTTAVPATTNNPCLTAGRFPNTTDSTCQAYYFCYLEKNGTYTLTLSNCPTTTVFNVNTQTCVLPTAYTCPY